MRGTATKSSITAQTRAPQPTTTIYVVWSQNDQGIAKFFLKKSTDGGNTFGSAKTITSTSYNTDGPSMAVDSSKNVYVTWTEENSNKTNRKILFKKSTDGGNTFGSAKTITSTSNYINGPEMVVASSKNTYIIWNEGNINNGSDIFFKKSTNGGNTFGPSNPINISNSASKNMGWGKIAVDLNNNIYVGWSEYISKQKTTKIFLKKSTDGGNNFKLTTEFNAPHADGVELAVDLNNIYVSWYSFESGSPSEVFIKKSTDGGLSFGPVTKIYSNKLLDAYHLDLAVKLNKVYVTWREDTQSGLRLVIKKSTDGGNHFGPATEFWNSSSDSDRVAPRIDLGADNNIVYVVWRDIISNQGNKILFKRSNDGGNTFTPATPKVINSGKFPPNLFPEIAVRYG